MRVFILAAVMVAIVAAAPQLAELEQQAKLLQETEAQETAVDDLFTGAISNGCIYLTNKVKEYIDAMKATTTVAAPEAEVEKRNIMDVLNLVNWLKNTGIAFSIPKTVILGLADCGLPEFCEALECPDIVKTSLSYLDSLATVVKFL